MQIEYRQLFLKDLKKLKKQPIYQRVFEILPEVGELKEVSNIKALKGSSNRYRIHINDYRVGIELSGEKIKMMRVLHRREFYRYFP